MLMMMPRNAKKSKLLELIGVENLKDATAKQFGAFVDYDQKPDDGGWLTTAMELNLIKDVVNIGNRYSDNIKQIADGRYFSEDGSSHNVFEFPIVIVGIADFINSVLIMNLNTNRR